MSDAVDQIDATAACPTNVRKTSSDSHGVVTDAVDEDPFVGSAHVRLANGVIKVLSVSLKNTVQSCPRPV